MIDRERRMKQGLRRDGGEDWSITRMNFQAAEDDGESIVSDEILMSARRK